MTEDTTTGLPASFELAWGVRERSAKGPKGGLTLRRILDAAIKVADSEGLKAVSMSRVAAELDAATMALYRHVAAKDELIALMADAAPGPPPDLAATCADWRDGLNRWTRLLREAYHRHPWVVQLPVSGPPNTPNSVAWMEQALRCMRGSGLTSAEQISTLLLVSGHARSHALLEVQIAAATAAAGANPAELMVGYGAQLAKVADPGDFPALHAVIATGVLDEPDDNPDEDFHYGLERILDGVEAFLTARQHGARPV